MKHICHGSNSNKSLQHVCNNWQKMFSKKRNEEILFLKYKTFL